MKAKTWVVILSLAATAAGVGAAWWLYQLYAGNSVADGIIVASGRLEGRPVRVSAGTAGRVIRLAVREGDKVAPGQIIAEIDRRDEEAAAAGARAGVAAAEAGVVAAERRVDALEAQAELARTEAARYRRLFDRDAAPRQAVDRAEAELESLQNELRAARAAHILAKRQLDLSRAQLQAVEIKLGETTITAPIAGIVTAELARAGEMVAPGQPVVELMSVEDIKLRVYLPLQDAERVRPGMEARVYVDPHLDRTFTGRVERIATEAEFTPKDVHMPDERTTLVFAVDIRIPNPDGALKDGFPADAFIRWDPAAPWPERPPW